MLSAEQMRSLPDVFRTITDPRSRYGRRYRLETLLGLAAAATLCGARGSAMRPLAGDAAPLPLPPCQRRERPHLLSAQRDPPELDAALRAWFSPTVDASLDRRRLKGAVPSGPYPSTGIAWGQKKPVDDGSDKRTNEIGVAIPLLDQLGDLAGKTVTADALLTQTAIASYLRKHDDLLNDSDDVRLGTARNRQRLSPFPGVGQARVRKGRVQHHGETSWGVDAQRLLRINRGHWTIENSPASHPR